MSLWEQMIDLMDDINGPTINPSIPRKEYIAGDCYLHLQLPKKIIAIKPAESGSIKVSFAGLDNHSSKEYMNYHVLAKLPRCCCFAEYRLLNVCSVY